MKIAMVFTSKPLQIMINEGGSGYWTANKKRISKCDYLIATKSNTLREHFPSDIEIKQGAAFLIGKISSIGHSPNGERLLIRFSEYAEINIPDVWPGNRNPVSYDELATFEATHNIDITTLDWKPFPSEQAEPVPDEHDDIEPLTINQAKAGLAKSLGIDPSCIEIQIKA